LNILLSLVVAVAVPILVAVAAQVDTATLLLVKQLVVVEVPRLVRQSVLVLVLTQLSLVLVGPV
jgi:hypothetical protein